MEDKQPIERYPENRCQSRGREKPGRTHLCKLTNGHTGRHYCICSRSWEQRTEATR